MKPRPGYVKLATIRGVPVFVHWSFPLGGVLFAVLGKAEPTKWVYYCAAFTLLVVIHECGHLFAAAWVGLRIFAVEISGLGGLCRVERPRNSRQSLIVYAAGLIAQAILFLGTIGYLKAFDTPKNYIGRIFVLAFTLLNLWMFIINLIPRRNAQSGLATDGSVLWRLLLHVYRGGPHPFPPLELKPPDQAPVFPSDTRILDMPGRKPPGFIHGIEMLNDRTTPMDFVVSCLVHRLGLTEREAILRMIEIHNTGGTVFKLSTALEAQRVAEAVSMDARAAGHALTCRSISPPR